MATAEQRIAALEKEKAAYEARKLPDRVKEVDASIKRIKEAATAEPEEETEVEEAPKAPVKKTAAKKGD